MMFMKIRILIKINKYLIIHAKNFNKYSRKFLSVNLQNIKFVKLKLHTVTFTAATLRKTKLEIEGSGKVAGKLHDVVITEFLDKYFIIISDNGKIGTLVQTVFETNAMKTSTSLTSKVLFGKDEPEIHAVAQSIVEVLKIKKPVVFGFSAKEYNSTTAVDMRQLIAGMLEDSEQNKLHNPSSIP